MTYRSDKPVRRYDRQLVLAEIGEAGQRKLREASALVVGVGALGTVAAELLVRAGIGRLRLVDRDVVEITNLQRQLLFDEQDATLTLPKAEAAARRLQRINSEVVLDPKVVDVAPHNVRELVAGVDVLVDGTDNLETRHLLNEACLSAGVPWVYGGAVGTTGMVMRILPGRGPCLRCVFGDPPPPGVLPTCDTMGVLNTATALVASLQVTEAIKILVGPCDDATHLSSVDVWKGTFQSVAVKRAKSCPACVLGQRPFLEAVEVGRTTRLCGRNAIQVDPAQDLGVSLPALAERLSAMPAIELGERPSANVLRFWAGEIEIVLFADGRAIVKGTSDPVQARSLYARYVGV